MYIFVGTAQKTFKKNIVWVKMIDFYFMSKTICIFSKDHVPWKKCIAKNFIWTTLKAYFVYVYFILDSRY